MRISSHTGPTMTTQIQSGAQHDRTDLRGLIVANASTEVADVLRC